VRELQKRRALSAPLKATRRLGLHGAHALLIAAAVAVVAADQISKQWALDHARVPRHVVGPVWFVLTFNKGAAFGLGRGVYPFVVAAAVALLVGLFVFSRRLPLRRRRGANLGLGLVVGGALGNLADRFLRGHGGAVVDFIDALQVGAHQLWPVFNVADASIVVGVLILGSEYALRARHRG
jgi:signal peptidase II